MTRAPVRDVLSRDSVPFTDERAFPRRGHAIDQETPMFTFVHALALLPAFAAIIVVLTALADRREANAMNVLRSLDPVVDLDVALAAQDDPESCAA
jgi:hypothetical protein